MQDTEQVDNLRAEIKRLKDGLREMVSYTAIYGEIAGEHAGHLLKSEDAQVPNRVKTIIVFTDDDAEEAMYVDGKLFQSDITIYAIDIESAAEGKPVIIRHEALGFALDEYWPETVGEIEKLKERHANKH